MAYTLKKELANSKNYGGKRSLSNILFIVIHFTANDGDTDENNGKYFVNNEAYASAHYFVDSDSVTQSVPDDYVAYSVGGAKYSNCASTGGGTLYEKATNANTLSIELCDDVKNGTIYPSAKTIENAIAFTKAKMIEYGIPAKNVIRHFDVNGKSCPAYWCGSTAKDKKWKTEFWNKLSTTATSATTTTSAYYKKYTGKSGAINTVLKAVGVPEKYRGTWAKRKPVATANGIKNYTGTAAQNSKLITLAKNGKLKKV